MASLWNSINNVLVVVHHDEIKDLKDWREAIKESGLNVHSCRILSVVPSKKERQMMGEISYVVFLSEGDFGLLGNLKNEEAKKLFTERFDAVISVGDFKGKIAKSVNRLKPKLDIGLNTVNNHTISLASEESEPFHLFNFVKQTLEKLS